MNPFFKANPLNILIVEDNPGDFLLLKESIAMSAIVSNDIQLADTLESAIEQLKQSKPDIVFLDLFLPDSSGLASFRQLREYMPHSAVIILSGLSDTNIALEAIAQGAQDFLGKGEFDEKLLEKTIMYSLERKSLARQQALFRVLIERSPDIKTLISPEGTILYGTPAITTVLGYRESEFIGCNEKEIIHPADATNLFAVINQTIADPQHIGRIQVRVRHKDGHYLWCDEVITNLLHDPYVNAIVCNFWDITKEKEAEDKIRKSEEKYRQIFYDNSFPMFLYDFDTLNILECNDATLVQYGYTREEFLELSILDIRPPEDINLVKNNIAGKSNEMGNRIWRHRRKNGEVIMVEVYIYTIEYAGKKVRQAQIHDVTERLRLSAALEDFRIKQQKAVTQATIKGQEKEREQLGIELHDNINQILATAKLYLDFSMTSGEVDKDVLLKSKEFIVLAANEIRKLSHTLLPPSLEEFGLVTAMNELVHPLTATASFIIETEWDSFPEARFEKEQKLTIYRIVQEQLNNIIKHAKAKKVIISLCLDEKAEGLELSIRDDGEGFDQAEKRNGVGLRNITSRAGLFGGVVNIFSNPGEGCELKVIFPVHAGNLLTTNATK
jgi:PAS domain S-box-containing protein